MMATTPSHMEWASLADTELIHLDCKGLTVRSSWLVPPRTVTHSNRVILLARRKAISLSELNSEG